MSEQKPVAVELDNLTWRGVVALLIEQLPVLGWIALGVVIFGR